PRRRRSPKRTAGRLLAGGDPMLSWRTIRIGLTAFALLLGAKPDLTLAHPQTPDTEVELEGTVEIFHEDLPGAGRYYYFLHSGGVRYSLHFERNGPEHLQTGATIRVKGAKVDNTLALGDGKKVKPVTPAPTPSTLGEQRVLVFLINFQDDPAEPYTAADAQSAVFGATGNFVLEGSYGQAWLTGDVVGWLTIPLSSTVCDPSTLASQAQSAASAAAVNLSAYAHYVYMFPNNACGGPGQSTIGGNPSQSWINGTLDLSVIAHEFGHALGLWHSHALDCNTVTLGSG